MNKQEVIYRMFASRAAVLENESRKPTQQEAFDAKRLANFLSDVVTAAGLLSHGRADKALAQRISEGAYALMTSLKPKQVQPLTDEQVFELAEPFGSFEYGDSQGDKRLGFVRAIEAAHGIK